MNARRLTDSVLPVAVISFVVIATWAAFNTISTSDPAKPAKRAAAGVPVVVTMVLDESGSMDSQRDEVIAGYNQYLESLREQSGERLVTLTTFSEGSRTQYASEDVRELDDLTSDDYVPDGGTGLYDAVGDAVKATENRLAELNVEAARAVVVIMTDGEENASERLNVDDIRAMVNAREEQGSWTFVYLGANQDAWAVGEALGVEGGNTMEFDAAESERAFADVAAGTAAFGESKQEQTDDFFGDGEKG